MNRAKKKKRRNHEPGEAKTGWLRNDIPGDAEDWCYARGRDVWRGGRVWGWVVHIQIAIICNTGVCRDNRLVGAVPCRVRSARSEEHTSELQSLRHLVC